MNEQINQNLAANVLRLGNEVRDLAEENARLKAEVERLETDVWRMKVFKGIDEATNATLKDALNTVPEWAKVLEVEAENARLKAEVERLEANTTKLCTHGDAEITRLKAEVERLTAFTTRTIIPNKELQAQVERLTKAVMHSPAAQLKLKELEGKTTFEEINPKGGQP